MKAKNLGKTYGYPFGMVWSYLPKGVQLTTGSLDKVNDYLAKFPTHHACVHWYNFHSVIAKSWRVFGKSTGYVGSKDKYKKYSIEMRNVQTLRSCSFLGRAIVESKLCSNINANHKYLIALSDRTIPSDEDQYVYIKSYRRLPKSYMKDWKTIKEIMKV